jgi:hypothetical protein
MARTLSQILTDANAFLDLEAAEPTGTELATRTNYANQAVWDAANAVQFPELHRIYEVDPGSNSRVSLPGNFREFMTSPKQYTGGAWVEFPEISPLERFSKSSGDKYCYVTGNPMEGYDVVFNGLTANATISMDFQRFPSGLATLSDICELPDAQYVVTKVESYVLKSRSDDRFPLVENDANIKLQGMIGRSMKTNGRENITPRTSKGNYSIGG